MVIRRFTLRRVTASPRRRVLLLLSGYLTALALPLACASPQSQPAATTASTSIAGTRPSFKPAFAAIAYYDTSCRRCHGPDGSFYGPELGKNLDDAGLIKIVKDMANGPGQNPLEPDQLAVETAYHRAIMAGEPFLIITGLKDNILTGEVMTDSTITLTLPTGQTLQAKVDGSAWTATLPPNTKPENITITAELKNKKTTLKLPNTISHTTPLPATQPATQPTTKK